MIFTFGINLVSDSIDVNVTPDKRMVMLHQETALLAIIKVT